VAVAEAAGMVGAMHHQAAQLRILLEDMKHLSTQQAALRLAVVSTYVGEELIIISLWCCLHSLHMGAVPHM
jgi:hypothetical protein